VLDPIGDETAARSTESRSERTPYRSSIMSLLDNVLGSSVPGGNLAKPLGIALLAFLASRATGSSGAAGPESGGALGGLLSGGLGGLLGNLTGSVPGTASIPQDQAHTAMSGGLGELLQRFQQNGYGDIVNSWIGTSANQPIAPDQLHKALGPGVADELSQQTGVPRNELLSQLSQALPTMVDRFTPNGRIPDQDEMARAQPR
jgi:uncharacterized protein YidB (DUF937 family)